MDKNIVKLFLRYHLSLYLCVLFASQICFAQSSALEKVLLLPTVNQKTLPEALLFLKDMQGNYLISQQNWQALGLKLPTNLPLSIDGGSYYRLNDLADIQFEVNPKKSIINLMADARFFSKSTLKYPNSQWIANNNNSKGAYLNYDISLLNQNDTFYPKYPMNLTKFFSDFVFWVFGFVIFSNFVTRYELLRPNAVFSFIIVPTSLSHYHFFLCHLAKIMLGQVIF